MVQQEPLRPNPYGFCFHMDGIEALTGDSDFDETAPSSEQPSDKESRIDYSPMHSAIKRNRDWFR